ncbi:MAG: phosphoenolpyruvate carboxykinase (ATP) [Pseudolabrys sp.]
MQESGVRNGAYGADRFGFRGLAAVHWNLIEPALYEHAVRNGEATIVAGGALCAETGHHTGRSPKDKHTVCDELTENSVWWDNNRKMTPAQFDALLADFQKFCEGKTLYAQDLVGGADPKYRIRTRVFTEYAWHSLFIRQLLIRPERVGDDEHGWGPDGIFNLEGGCYAKCIRLSQEAEPQIWAATHRFGAVLENVVFDPDTRVPDYDDGSKTENTRSAYPLDFIPNASRTGRADHPKNIIFLTADAFGVMPPIAKLDPNQAMYHFLSGYTAKVAGTEKGLVGVQPEFSTCFGAPFLPRHPSVYADLLKEYIRKHKVDCWLVNSGWTGGKYGEGRRMPIKATRTLLTAALSGSLKDADYRTDPYFGFSVPTSVKGVEPHLLNPYKAWKDKAEFDKPARALVGMFQKNFTKFESHVTPDIKAAAPEVRIAAE